MLRTNGREIIREDGSSIRLRGMNLGNWMLIEPNMFGTAGTEIKTRRTMEALAGQEKTDRFFNGLINKWVTEKDIAYIHSLGMNSIRIPMNYRYFENDREPYEYLETGFAQIDRILQYCRKYRIYAVLDMHAAQGGQSGDWHCNNIFQERIDFYYDKTCEDRYIALWKEFARRYKDEEWIAGYDLLNEPVVETKYEIKRLKEIYLRVIKEIRSIDRSHLIFIEGNQWAQKFEMLDDNLYGDNIVYSPHYYCDAAVQDWDYPGETDGIFYDREYMESEMKNRDSWIRQKGRPVWVGEFGVRRLGNLNGKNQALKDYLEIFESRGESWCYWNFKDLKVRGPLCLREDSAWAQFTKSFIDLKRKYCTDRSLPVSDDWKLDMVFKDYRKDDFMKTESELKELLMRNLRETLASELTWTFAEKFSKLNDEEIDELTDSFLFENCRRYEQWEEILKKACKKNANKDKQIIPFSTVKIYTNTDEKMADSVLKEAIKEFDRKIIVLDDDPTGVQTVHDVTVFTDWEEDSVRQGFLEAEPMFYILTNSRSLSPLDTEKIHREIAEHICNIAEELDRKFVLISRSDSTLRGHFPLETAALSGQLKDCGNMVMSGEIICPFFPEGGRFTIDNIHYVKDGDRLIPTAMTEFAKDSTFSYTESDLCKYVEEKTKAKYRAEDCVTISLEELNACDVKGIYDKLMKTQDFQKVIVNAVCYADLKVFAAAMVHAVKSGKEFIVRSAASLPKVLGRIEDQPLLCRDQLIEQTKNGGLVLVGSYVKKTTQQLDELRTTDKDVDFIEFHVRACFDDNLMEDEISRIVEFLEERIAGGHTVVIYTSRRLLSPADMTAEEKLRLSVRISEAVTSIIKRIEVKPRFLIAKGGITSSDVGTKALNVKKARVMGQVRKGIPVWMTGAESKFPGMPYIIFPGNVGEPSTLKEIVEELI